MFIVGSVMTYLDADVQTGLNLTHHHLFLGGAAAAYGMRYVFPGLPSGDYDLWKTWPTGWNDRTTSLNVEVFDDTVSELEVQINQSVAPSGVSDLGVDWTYIGRININSGTLKIEATGKTCPANQRIVLDAVRAQRVSNGDLHYGDDGAWPSTGSAFQSRRLGQPIIGARGVRIY